MSAVATVDGVIATDEWGRCDACNSSAGLVRVMVATGSLDFCRRCLIHHAAGLKDKTVDVALAEAAAGIMLTDAWVCELLGVTR